MGWRRQEVPVGLWNTNRQKWDILKMMHAMLALVLSFNLTEIKYVDQAEELDISVR